MKVFRLFNPSLSCLTLSAIGLGHAIQLNEGFYSPEALYWMSGSLVLGLAGMGLHRLACSWSPSGDLAVRLLLLLGIAWQLAELLTTAPGRVTDGNLNHFKTGIWIQGVTIAACLFRPQWSSRLWFPALLVVSTWLGMWMIRATPDPYIDVVEVHNEALNALLHGDDPYRISFKNIYESEDAARFYKPEALIGNRLAFGYPYPPPSLLLVIPGHVLAGDYRYSELCLLVLAAACMGYGRAGMTPKLAAALLLTTPRIWFVLEKGWTEPVAVFLLALTVFLMLRCSVPAAFVAGVFVVTKQYLGFAGLAVWRLMYMRAASWPWTIVAAIVAAAASILPFLLWHPNAFMRSVIWLQLQERFRPDSLSFLSWAASRGYGSGSYLWAMGAAIATTALSTVATRNTPSGFAVSVAVTTFAMFAFGSKAFCNYYFFVIGALCCAIAAWPDRTDQDQTIALTLERADSGGRTA
jgi:hypothetical protein